MVFSSLVFLCLFLPVVFVLYSIIRNLRIRNALLIVASLVFYAYGEPIYVLIMIFSSLLNYFAALWIDKFKKHRKLILVLAVVINLCILCGFKYTSMIIDSINNLFSISITVPQITLPIGISFFTFQALSYVIDVYRKSTIVQKNYFYVLLYISFFPQLIAGPIVKYRDIVDQINYRKQTIDNISRGFRRFIVGLSKKVLIANSMGVVADNIFNSEIQTLTVFPSWLGAIAYLFQIYYDFSGYSDMAIGLGLMFGFEFKENFMYPYGSTSVQDFWRKWHISLSTWFKEYLYIPLGGNRKGKVRTVINRLIVFFFTGLWHGANWTFVIWGLWHGLFLLLEEFIPLLRKLPKVLSNIYTLLVVTLGFVIFRADNISQGFEYIGQMFSFSNYNINSISLCVEQLTPYFIVMFICAVIGCAPIKPIVDKIRSHTSCAVVSSKWKVIEILLYVLSLVLLVFCMIRLSSSSYNPFIYFRF